MLPQHAFHCEHSTLLVLLSYKVSVLGAYCGLHWAALIPHVTGSARAGRVAAAAVATGGGAIWSMHFIAMIACRLPVPVTYHLPLTLTSMAVAIAVTGLGLHVVATGPGRARLAAGGTFAGLGIAAMHYTGMAAMQLPARMVFEPWLVVASVVIAIVAATAALWMTFATRPGLWRLLSAAVMGVAVCGMHYTAMAAVGFWPVAGHIPRTDSVIQTDDLGIWVFAATILVLGLLGIALRVDARERDAATRTSELARLNERLKKEVADQRRVDRAVREAEERATGILEGALDAVITMDERGIVTSWNLRAEQMFGWTRQEAVGAQLSSLIIPEPLREQYERGLRHYLSTAAGPVLRRLVELTARHRDGDEFGVEVAISVGLSSGRPIVCGFVRDITERKRAGDALRERTLYLNTLVEHSPMAIAVVDPTHRVQLVNPAFERLFLYDRNEAVGTDLDDLIEPGGELSIECRELTARVLAGESVHVTTVRRRKDGQAVDVEVYALPLTAAGDVTGIYVLYHDIRAQRELEEQLRQSQKIEAIGTLAGGIAHDFNNLLTTILGYSDLVLSSVDASSPLRSDLEEIKKAGQRAESLTRQLLAFSRKQIAVLTVLDLHEIVRDMENMLRRLVAENIAMTITLGPPAWCVKADRGHIEQVLMNLIVNGRDAMPDGGKLSIAVRNVTHESSSAPEHLGIPAGRYVTLTVTDTGVGMDAATRLRIFEPFFSTKPHGVGTGLGLSTVYGILKQSGGHVTVDSEPGYGSTFAIWLPKVDEEMSPVAKEEAVWPARGNETILLVEDDDTLRRLARTVLTRQGYTILEAANGDEALRLAARTREHIDLVVSDGMMPGITVGAMIAELRAARPNAKVLIMSGYTSEVIIRRGILDAELPFLQKPFTNQALLAKVRDVLKGADMKFLPPPPGPHGGLS